MKESLARKLKREKVEACLNCTKFVRCENIGRFEECTDFEEVEEKVWTIREFSVAQHGHFLRNRST